jgi:hypothetical protein
MVHDVPVHELVLGVLLWLGVQVYWRWQQGLGKEHPPAQRIKRLAKAPTPFAA